MKSKEIYQAIDLSKVGPTLKTKLTALEKVTEGFTNERADANMDKAMNGIYEYLKKSNPESLKNIEVKTVEVEEKVETIVEGKPVKKTTKTKKKVAGKKKKVASKTKTPSSGAKRPTVSSVASKIRKPGESWKDALGRAKVIFNDKKQTQDAKTKKAVDDLRDFLKDDKNFKGWPRTYGKEKASDNSLERDAQRQALPPGKRVSKTGRVYYENRDNRSDREANSFPRKIYLKGGGKLPEGTTYYGVNEIEFVELQDGTKVSYGYAGDGSSTMISGIYVTPRASAVKDEFQSEIEFAKGGLNKLDYFYIPRSEIKRVVLTEGFGPTEIDGRKVLNGIWMEKSDRTKQLIKEYNAREIKRRKKVMELGGEVYVQPTIIQNNPDYLVGTTTMYEMFELGGQVMVQPTILQNNPDYLVGTNTMYEMFADGGLMAKGGRTKGDIGKSGTQYGYTLKEYDEMGEKNGLFVSPKEWWSSQKGKKYTDNFGRTQTVGNNSQDERQAMQSYGYRIAIGMDLGSNKIPASAKKYVEDNNLVKADGGMMAKGGYVAVSENNGYWYIMSTPSSKEKAQQVIDMGVPRGEVGKVVTLEQAKAYNKVIGREYLEKGGGIYSSDKAWSVKVVLDDQPVDSFMVRGRNLKEARMMVEDYHEAKMEAKYGDDIYFEIEEAMAKGGGVTYKNLLLEKPSIVNETKIQSERFKINEIDLFRKSQNTFSGSPIIRSSADSVKIFREFWDEQSLTIYESFNVMLLNQANKVIGLYQHSKGGVTGTVADPEMVVLSAVKSLAKGVIISHNHPSGNLRPSQADIEMTNKIKNALKFVDVLLLDSIIITESSYYSFADEGIMALGGMTAKGGMMDNEEGVDLFEDYEDQPAEVQAILAKYELEDNDYNTLKDLQSELEQIGYTFEFGLDAEPFDLRKIGQKGKSEFYAKGGALEGKKRFDEMYNVGRAKYVVSFHDGVKKHNDGSDFFDLRTFKNKKDLEAFKKELLSNGYLEQSMAKGGEVKSPYIVTFGFQEDGEYAIKKSKPIFAENENAAAIMLKDQFEAYEGLSCDIINVKKMADGGMMSKGGAMEHMILLGDKVLDIYKNVLIVESAYGGVTVLDFRQEPIARRILVERITGKNTLASAKEFIDADLSFKTQSMAVGGSLQGHGFEVGDRIAEDLGGYIRVVSEDGKDYFIKLRDGDRLTEPPLPFKHGGKVKHSDVTRRATKTNETGDEVVDLTEFYEGGGNVPKVFDVPAQFLDAEGKRKNDRKTIKELTDFVLALPQTKEIYYNDELGDYTPSRKKLHAEIINKFKKEVVCIDNDKPIAIFMGGSPASGKSSFLRKYSPFLLKEEILKIDADEIRALLPEYEGWNATQTHLETKDIVNILLSNKNIGIPCDFDIIYDGTMNSVKSYIPLMDILRKRGYKIFIVFMDNVPKDVIIKRALDRYKTSGRFVPLEVIEDFFSKGKTAFNELKKDVDGYMLIDGSSQDYKVIEEGGMKLPRDREYSKLGTKIKASEIPVSYKKGGLGLLY